MRLFRGLKMGRRRTQTEGSDASDHFVFVNERRVEDIK